MSTLREIPWENKIPLLLVDFYDPKTNVPVPMCPRGLLKRVIASAAQNLSLQAHVGIEYEFFNFAETPKSLNDKKGVGLDKLTPGMFGYSVFRPVINQGYFYDILDTCTQFNVPIEGFHTETGI